MKEHSHTWDFVGEIGIALAMITSWTQNTSILWAILHGMCGWFYVIYYAIVY